MRTSAILLLVLCCVYGDDKKTQPTRCKIEVLYTIHKNVRTDEDIQRIVDLFRRTWPNVDLSGLEPNVRTMVDYFEIYRDRLLEQEGSSWKKVLEEFERPARDAAARAFAGAFGIVKDQVARELKVRGMYQWLHSKARKHETKSLKDLFAKLRKHDDPKKPVCSTEAGRGLIVYREFADGLTGDELENIEDSGVKFTHNFRARVTQMGDTDLPKLARRADVLGAAGEGRYILRLLEVIKDARKKNAGQPPR
ncbi:MAG: hypothetical protein ACYS0K_22065 [Planctomycetota bacterium]